MALGQFQANVSLDSSSDPDDTEVIAAPGANQRIVIHWLSVVVQTGQSTAVVKLENGSGGNALFVADASNNFSGAEHEEFPVVPLQLDENTALNAEVSGATGVVARALVGYEVRG